MLLLLLFVSCFSLAAAYSFSRAFNILLRLRWVFFFRFFYRFLFCLLLLFTVAGSMCVCFVAVFVYFILRLLSKLASNCKKKKQFQKTNERNKLNCARILRTGFCARVFLCVYVWENVTVCKCVRVYVRVCLNVCVCLPNCKYCVKLRGFCTCHWLMPALLIN